MAWDENADSLSTLYALARSIPHDHPAHRRLIGVLGREARHWCRLPERQSITDVVLPSGLRLHVDRSDRYGFDLSEGLILDATDLALFGHLAAGAREIVDVGSNIGLYALTAGHQSAAMSGRVAAFEPNPPIFALLKRNIDANGLADRITPHCLALSDRQASRTFHACRNSAFSGLDDTGRSPETAAIQLETRCLDDVWRERGARPCDLLKIDVEGHEAPVLAGAGRMIEASPDLVIQIEVSPKNHRSDLPAWQDALAGLDVDAFAYAEDLGETPVDLADTVADLDGNLFLCRPGGSARERLCQAVQAERRLRAEAPPIPDLVPGIDTLLRLLEEGRRQRDAMADVKAKVETRCQELAAKVQGRDRKIAALEAQIAAANETEACLDQRR